MSDRDESSPGTAKAGGAMAKAETPEALFERIRRRRGVTPAAFSPGDAGADTSRTRAAAVANRTAARPVSVDEVLPPSRPLTAIGDVAPEPGSPAVHPGTEEPAGGNTGAVPAGPAGPFPRSATMRLLLKHPELALGVGLPAAGLILGFPKSRRLLGAAIRLGTRPEIQQALQLTSVLRQRGRRSRSDSGSS